jgi:hypothetical protein
MLGISGRHTVDMDDALFSAESSWDVFPLAIGMAILATLLWMAYKTLQRPRLPVIHREQAPPVVTASGVVRYLVTTPILVTFWLYLLMFLLAAAARDRSGEQIVVAATAVIGGARLLAHIHEETAHELAKAVPIAILGFVLIGGGFTGWAGFEAAFEDIPPDLVDTYWLGLIVLDVVLTVTWFGWLRFRWRRQQTRITRGESRESRPERAWHRLRRIGYSRRAR